MFMCENCEGAGIQLWMRHGKPRFLPCLICAGERTIMWCFGAAPHPPLAKDIKIRRPASIAAAAMLIACPALAQKMELVVPPNTTRAIGVYLVSQDGGGNLIALEKAVNLFPVLFIDHPSIVVTMTGDQKGPIRALIEVKGSGNHCLLQFNDTCLIKGDYLEIR